jgi:hypothetical protein
MSITSVLRSSQAQAISFSLAGVRVDGNDFRRIATAIDDDEIHISVSSSLGTAARYEWLWDTLWVSRRQYPSTRTEESLIVHEAVHAMNDLHARSVTTIADESAAHVAQMLYLLLLRSPADRTRMLQTVGGNVPDAIAQYTRDPTAASCDRAVMGVALLIAGDLLGAAAPSDGRLAQLRNALQVHPWYAGQGPRHYDGIGESELDRLRREHSVSSTHLPMDASTAPRTDSREPIRFGRSHEQMVSDMIRPTQPSADQLRLSPRSDSPRSPRPPRRR